MAYADCLFRTQTSFAVMVGNLLSIASLDLISKVIDRRDEKKSVLEEGMNIPTTDNAMKTCLKSKGLPDTQ